MGIGVVFLLVVIAAAAAPFLWAIWWVAASVGGSSRPEVREPVVVPIRKARSTFAFPQPADLTLPRRRGAIAIFRLSDGAEIGSCNGPDQAGRCPRAAADGSVPCAGCLLSLPQPVRGSGEWHIPAGYQACPVGSYQVFRQPVH